MITCYKCGISKPEKDFNFANKEKGTRQKLCRKCFSEYNRERYLANKDKVKANVASYRKANPEKVYQTRLKSFEKNGTRGNCYRLIEAALKAGVIEKPDLCQVCGKKPDKRIEAHHEDYSKPLDIVWCCSKCHDELDRARRRKKKKKYHSGVVSVTCIETEEVYESIAQAARDIGVAPNTISQCLSGKGKTAGGFHWRRTDN